MRELNIFVCEIFFDRFTEAAAAEGFEEAGVKAYARMCENKEKQKHSFTLPQGEDIQSDRVILCCDHCDFIMSKSWELPEGISYYSKIIHHPSQMQALDINYNKVLIRSIVLDWRLYEKNKEFEVSLSNMEKQCADYLAILNFMEQIASFTVKREVIAKIKELFLVIFGAQKCIYWPMDKGIQEVPQPVKNLCLNPEKKYVYSKEDHEIYIRIDHKDITFGVLEIGDFLFPKYSKDYLNFAICIVRVAGLVLSNVEHYERLVKSEKDLKYISYHDSLTGLYNRTYYNELLENYNEETPMAVFVFDIDRLKYVNDHFGHLEGDRLIGMAAQVLNKCFRESDMIARVGGDEFAVIAYQCDIPTAERLEKRIYEEIQKHNSSNKNRRYELSISVGFAAAEGNQIDLGNLFKEADKIMYMNKAKKRNLVM